MSANFTQHALTMGATIRVLRTIVAAMVLVALGGPSTNAQESDAEVRLGPGRAGIAFRQADYALRRSCAARRRFSRPGGHQRRDGNSYAGLLSAGDGTVFYRHPPSPRLCVRGGRLGELSRLWRLQPRNLGGPDVFEPWPYVPGDIWGYRYVNPVRQPIGQRQVQTSPTRWESFPIYEEDLLPAVAAPADADPVGSDPGASVLDEIFPEPPAEASEPRRREVSASFDALAFCDSAIIIRPCKVYLATGGLVLPLTGEGPAECVAIPNIHACLKPLDPPGRWGFFCLVNPPPRSSPHGRGRRSNLVFAGRPRHFASRFSQEHVP